MPGMLDEPRAHDAAICPFLRQLRDGSIQQPLPAPDAANACIATADPRPQSLRQQELLCLHLSHADCPRYLRGGVAGPNLEVGAARQPGQLPRATVAALLVLILSAGISFGFVLRRGGIDLPSFGAAPSAPLSTAPSPSAPLSTAAAVVPSVRAESASPMAGSPSSELTASPSMAASLSPSPSPSPSLDPSPTPELNPTPAPTTTPKPIPLGSPSRMKLVTACPGVADCYIYKIRTYTTLSAISTFFGVKLSRIYDLNPGLNPRTLHNGQAVKIPTPTH